MQGPLREVVEGHPPEHAAHPHHLPLPGVHRGKGGGGGRGEKVNAGHIQPRWRHAGKHGGPLSQ